MNWFDDDKNLVIIAVLILGMALIFVDNLGAEQSSIINSIVSGLFGIAVGRGMK
jgi:hypothetical protein